MGGGPMRETPETRMNSCNHLLFHKKQYVYNPCTYQHRHHPWITHPSSGDGDFADAGNGNLQNGTGLPRCNAVCVPLPGPGHAAHRLLRHDKGCVQNTI